MPGFPVGAATSVARATLADIVVLAPLFDAYRVFYGQPSDAAAARAFLAERIGRAESVVFLARDASDAALGFVQLYPAFSSVSARRLWILNDLYVHPSARRLGVARMLMDAARGHAAQTGAVRLVLETAEDNGAAQVLYESLGYARECATRHYLLAID